MVYAQNHHRSSNFDQTGTVKKNKITKHIKIK